MHLPRIVQGLILTMSRRAVMRHWVERHGRVFAFHVPYFGRCVAVSDPALVRSVSTASAEQLTNYQPNLTTFFGPGSVFALDGPSHHERRRLLGPAFHGQSIRHFEAVIVDEVLRESASWPDNTEFAMREPMTRITLNVIMRTIFGAEGSEIERLHAVVPRYTKSASTMVKFMPVPKLRSRRYGPWRRVDHARREFDKVILSMIERAVADPRLCERTDVLALLIRAGATDGAAMSPQDICDELVTLIGAGHETTAAALCWAFERLRRHPDVLAELVKEVDDGGSVFRRATVMEVLRIRPVIDLPGRWVRAAHFDLGEWRIPHGHNIFVSLPDLQENPEIFPSPNRFDPSRFLDTVHSAPAWLAFGSGARRCIGADFATNEIDIVLRTVLQNFTLQTDSAAGERTHFKGVAHAPHRGGRVTINRRRV